ncbi:hypothetical protein N7462_007900 [Penicillium macrosclerotiorum]|uniref:uncharacterized protein n=1 Tax=Penicillium macrosclerotiorum TaxID=303699 RepID=UPI0025491927|nr:uncharacterized protein N7462_007900 [Penicillium macrosclerotiorum]KAJ5679656.1 hypothetical protein N7462_007900 [Penicillium macrosclerotiorum]
MFRDDAPKGGRRVRWFGREDPGSGDPRSNGRLGSALVELPIALSVPPLARFPLQNIGLFSIGISSEHIQDVIPAHLTFYFVENARIEGCERVGIGTAR